MLLNTITEHSVRTPMWVGGDTALVNLLLLVFVGFGISQIILGLLLISRNTVIAIQQKLYAALLVTLLAYFIAPFTVETPYHIVIITLMTALPGLFWLFCFSLFDDDFTLKLWQVMLVALTVVLPFSELLARQLGYTPANGVVILLVDIPAIIELLLVGFALVVIARHWRVDLVQSRRDLRLWFCGVNGVYLFILLILREVFYPHSLWLEYGQYASAGLALLVTNVMFLRMSSGILVESLSHPSKSSTNNAANERITLLGEQQASDACSDTESKHVNTEFEEHLPNHWILQNQNISVPAEMLEQIRCALEEECIYRDMDITIGLLAYRLDIPEYKLRAVINSGLGYRNFNDFLNSYRIKEVAKRLAAPEDEKNSVLTIALDAGFRSISSFNKVFKDTYDTTPTAYRQKVSQ